MNLYLVISHEPSQYCGAFDSCVVSAENEDDARTIHPSEIMTADRYEEWVNNERSMYSESWIPFSRRGELEVRLIGTSCVTRGIVLPSFNAG